MSLNPTSFRICGTGHAVPAFELTNEALTRMVETSDEWIVSRTGIQSRRIITDESLLDLATKAAQNALLQARISVDELDLIICATMQADTVTPSLACMVQKRLGALCPAFDVNAACTGFIYALDVAAGYFARGRVQKVLVIAAECLSKHVDWEDRSTCVLFGDGAGAAVLAAGEGLLSITLTSDGNDEALVIPGTPGGFPCAKEEGKKQTLHMNGQEIYRFAVNAIARDVDQVLREAGVRPEEVKMLFLHQANRRILDTAAQKLGMPPEKVAANIGQYGNTSAASIPILLDEKNRAGEIQQGDVIVLCAFGGGLTTGAAVIRW